MDHQLPDKGSWKKRTKLSYIQDGMEHLLKIYEDEGLESIAFPALGCGLGGMDVTEVWPHLKSYLKRMTIPTEIWLTEKDRRKIKDLDMIVPDRPDEEP